MRISDWSSDVCSSDLVLDRADRHLGVDDVGAMLNRADIMHADSREQLASDLESAQGIEKDVPLVRIAQAHRIGTQEQRSRSEERRGGKACGSTGRYRWSPYQ